MNDHRTDIEYRTFWPGCPIRIKDEPKIGEHAGILGEVVGHDPNANPDSFGIVTTRHDQKGIGCLTWVDGDVEPIGPPSVLGVGDYWIIESETPIGTTVRASKVIGCDNRDQDNPIFVLVALGYSDEIVLLAFDKNGLQIHAEYSADVDCNGKCTRRHYSDEDCLQDAIVNQRHPRQTLADSLEAVTDPMKAAVERLSSDVAKARSEQVDRLIALGLRLTETTVQTEMGPVTTWQFSKDGVDIPAPPPGIADQPAATGGADEPKFKEYEGNWQGVGEFFLDHGFSAHRHPLWAQVKAFETLAEAGYTVWLNKSNGWCWDCSGEAEVWHSYPSHPAAVLAALHHMHEANTDA